MRLAVLCIALLLAIIPAELILTGGKGVTPTNLHETPEYIAQLNANPLPGSSQTDDAAALEAQATDGYVKLSDAIQQAAIEEQAAAKDLDAGAGSDGAPATAKGKQAGSTIDQNEALAEAVKNLNDALTNMPGSFDAFQEEQSVASTRSSQDVKTQDNATKSATSEKITDIQDHLNKLNKLISGESTAGTDTPTATDNPNGKENGANGSADTGQGSDTQTPAATPKPTAEAAPTPTPAPVQASAYEAETQPEPEEDQDVDDETAMITLDIIAIPPAKIPTGISEEAASIEAFIEVALAQVGKPYSTGGKGPDRFDCSGFVYYALNTSGYSLGYMTSATWAGANFTTIDSIDSMQRGDVICMKGHVAIYLGDGVMVDASSRNGKIVVRDVGSWVRRNFRNAKRIWNVPVEEEVAPRDIIELNIIE